MGSHKGKGTQVTSIILWFPSLLSWRVLLSWCLFYCLDCFKNNWISSLVVRKAPLLETVLGRSDYFPCCPLPSAKVFYRETAGTQACSYQAGGRPPEKHLRSRRGWSLLDHTWGLLLTFLINATYSHEWRGSIRRGNLRKSLMGLSNWICLSLRTSRTEVKKELGDHSPNLNRNKLRATWLKMKHLPSTSKISAPPKGLA